jgi:hypothetical protein
MSRSRSTRPVKLLTSSSLVCETEPMTSYHIFLIAILVLWPSTIFGILFLMDRLERIMERPVASTPEEAGLAPVSGSSEEREVQIVFEDRVVEDSSSQGAR